MTSKINFKEHSSSGDWANDVQNALGLDSKNVSNIDDDQPKVEPVTNTSANLSNPITNSSKLNEKSANGEKSANEGMPGSWVGTTDMAVSLKDASNQAKDAFSNAYDVAAAKVGAYGDNKTEGANALHEVAERLNIDENSPGNPLKQLADDTQPGKVSQYGSTLAAGAAGVAGAAGLSGIGISTAKATSKNENEKSKYDVSNNGSLANPMDFPKGTHPDLEKLFEDPQSIPIIPGVTKLTSKKPKERENNQKAASNTETLGGVTAGVGGAGAATATVANKFVTKGGQSTNENTDSDTPGTIATDKTGHDISPPGSQAQLYKNQKNIDQKSDTALSSNQSTTDNKPITSNDEQKVTPKRSFSQRIKGEAKILFGKLSKNENKVEKGKELKNGSGNK